MSPAWLTAGRIPTLDGFRALAVVTVTVGHLTAATGSPVPALGALAKHFAGTGVDLFFVISGFLITHLLLQERERHGRISLRGFYLRRTLRILPAYGTMLGTCAVLAAFGALVVDPRAWLPALTYTYNCFTWADVRGIGHVWSLCVEEHFYLVWPLVLILLSVTRAPIALVFAVCAAAATRVLIRGPGLPDPDLFSPARMDTLAIGCLLAFAVRTRWLATAQRLARGRSGWVAVAAVAFLVVSVLVLSRSGKYTLGPKRPAEAIAMAALLLATILDENGRLARVLDSRPFVAVGVLSYSLYLAQPFANATSSEGWPLSWWWGVPCVIGYALLSYILVERPFLWLKDRISRRSAKQAASPEIDRPQLASVR